MKARAKGKRDQAVATAPKLMAAAPAASPAHQALLDKRQETRISLGMRFDTLAGMGRVAEDDQALLFHEEYLSLDRNQRGWDQLRLIEEALDRLKSGEYGTCERCEEPIPAKRLAAIPWAKYCVRCQEKMAERQQWEREPELQPAELS